MSISLPGKRLLDKLKEERAEPSQCLVSPGVQQCQGPVRPTLEVPGNWSQRMSFSFEARFHINSSHLTAPFYFYFKYLCFY